MESRILFRERLTELKTAADETGGVLTREEIRGILKDMPLTEEHFQLIYEYLAGQGIRVVESGEDAENISEKNQLDNMPSRKIADAEAVTGKTAAGGRASEETTSASGVDAGVDASEETGAEEEISDESRRSLAMYLEELDAMSDVSDAEEILLIERLRSGDAAAKERLTGIYLPLICTMAEDYGEDIMASEDLIQEGNLGLLTAMESLDTFESAAACRVHILNTVRGAMEQAISDSRDGRKMDDGLLSRINHLNEAVHNLERDLGHKVSAEEVSAYLEMPVEEIEDLLRVTGDQIETEV